MSDQPQPQYPPPDYGQELGQHWPQQPPPGQGYPPPGYPTAGYGGYGYPPGYGAGYGYPPAGSPPPSRIGWAITALIFFWPLCIPAFIYSSRVDSAWRSGDVAGAERASANARTCGIVALVIGIVAALLMIVLVAAVTSDSSGSCVVTPTSNSC